MPDARQQMMAIRGAYPCVDKLIDAIDDVAVQDPLWEAALEVYQEISLLKLRVREAEWL